MKRKNSFLPFGIAALALAALAGGALLYSHTQPKMARIPAVQDVSVPQPILPEALPSPKTEGEDNRVTVFQIATDDNGSHLKKIQVTLHLDPPGKELVAQAALNAMASEPDSPLPTGTRVNSYSVADDLATVDFNQAFIDNFKGGDDAEALAINAILATVGQFGPHSVQITVAGKKIDSLGGTLSLTNPVPVPQVAEQTASSSGKP